MVWRNQEKERTNSERFDTTNMKQVGIEMAEGFGSRNIGTYASSVAFFFFLSLVPILILLSAVLPHLGMQQDDLIRAVSGITPDILDSFISSIIQQSFSRASHMVPLSALILIWAGSQGTIALVRGMNSIYRCKERRNYLLLTLISIVYTFFMLVLMFFMILIIFSHVLLDPITEVAADTPFGISIVIAGRYIIAVIFMILTFMLIYTFIPAGRRKFIHQLPGALVSAAAWAIFSLIFRFYINGVNRYNTFYGSLGTIAIFLFWLFCCFYILLVGGFVNCHFEKHIRSLFDGRRAD